MKEILLPQIKKWIVFALIGVTTYCAGYFLGKFYLDVKSTKANPSVESEATTNSEDMQNSEFVK